PKRLFRSVTSRSARTDRPLANGEPWDSERLAVFPWRRLIRTNAGEPGMWNKIRITAMVATLLTGTAAIAYSQSSSTIGAGGSAGGGTSSTSLGTGGSAAGGTAGTGSASTLGTGGSSAGSGKSSTSLGTGGSAAGTGTRSGTSSTLGTGGSTAGSERERSGS